MSARKIPMDAFEFYFALGHGRSYQAVAEKYGSSKTAVANSARREDWEARIAERERKAREKLEEKATETLADLNGRHLKMLRTVQGKALEALRSMSLDRAIDAVRALDIAIRNERLVLGEPTERHATDIEALIKREHERWLSHPSGDGTQSSSG